ncbi:MAG TPA: glutaminyl-peptide cyclotransferase [Planctomycetaceae bacterium]|nr:glutaminyl-peptide cyclotransferase [Planctomycetaceae bacterium]
MTRRIWITGAVVTVIAAVGLAAALPRKSTLPVDTVRVIASYPHDPEAFSQGLVIADGVLYEGTGTFGASSLRQVDLKTGKVQRMVPLNQDYFGEGIAVAGNKIYQLTWKNRLGIVYDRESMTAESSFRYSGEGWGLTSDGKELILSDGTATLRFLSLETLEVTRRVQVHTATGPVDQLNELEYVDGEIYANIWYSDRIVRISPKTGEVLGWIDLSALYPARQRPSREHVLNGIAYDADKKQLYVTGKNWPKLYQVEVVKRR